MDSRRRTPQLTMRGRRIALAALLTAGTVLTVCAALGVWAQRQTLQTDAWVETSAQLLEDGPIRSALAAFLVDEVFSSDDLQARLTELLPPRLDPLAKPAAAGLEEIARRQAPRVLGSAAAVRAWRNANRDAHQALLRVLDGDGDGGAVALDLHRLVEQLAAKVGLPEGVAERLPPSLGQLEVLPADDVDTVRRAVNIFKTVAWVLVALALLCFAVALVLAPDRRRTLLSVGACMLLAAIVVLVLRRLGGNVLVDAITSAPNGEQPARDAWKIATSLLVDLAAGLALLGALLVAGAWISGPGRRAIALRRATTPTLLEHPGAARVGLGLALLLLVLWGPVPWTQRVVPMIVLAIAAFAWLEWVRVDARAAR